MHKPLVKEIGRLYYETDFQIRNRFTNPAYSLISARCAKLDRQGKKSYRRSKRPSCLNERCVKPHYAAITECPKVENVDLESVCTALSLINKSIYDVKKRRKKQLSCGELLNQTRQRRRRERMNFLSS